LSHRGIDPYAYLHSLHAHDAVHSATLTPFPDVAYTYLTGHSVDVLLQGIACVCLPLCLNFGVRVGTFTGAFLVSIDYKHRTALFAVGIGCRFLRAIRAMPVNNVHCRRGVGKANAHEPVSEPEGSGSSSSAMNKNQVYVDNDPHSTPPTFAWDAGLHTFLRSPGTDPRSGPRG